MKISKICSYFVLVLLFSVSVTSCSKDKDEEASVVGKWETTYEGDIIDGKEVLTPVGTNGSCPNNYMELLKDGTSISVEYDSKCKSYTENGTWSKNGNIITGKNVNDSVGNDAEILILDNTTLKIKEIISINGKTEIWITVFKKI